MTIPGLTKKPGEVDKVQRSPEAEEPQVVVTTGAHHGEKTPEGKSRKAKPERDPMEGEKTKEAERRYGDKATDLWGIDRVEIEILDFGSDEC